MRNSLKLYFSELSLGTIFQANWDAKSIEDAPNLFSNHSVRVSEFNYRTDDEISNLYTKLEEDWFKEPGKQYGRNKNSIFYLLTHFNEQVLSEKETNPIIKYEHLLKWRDLSYSLGEDVFTTSFFAYRDVQSQKKRGYFSWKSTVPTDNSRLVQLLQSGVAENHAHYAATGPTFELSWLVLMNRYKDNYVQKSLNDLIKDGILSPKMNLDYSGHNLGLHDFVKLAIMLRYDLLRNYLLIEDHRDVLLYPSAIQKLTPNHLYPESISIRFSTYWNSIVTYRNDSSPLYYHNGEEDFIDYAIPYDLHPENHKGCFYLAGERLLLYKSFSNIYKNVGKDNDDISDLSKTLHAYLLIKNTIRNEIVQLNRRLGFGNFKQYQDRKEFFIKNGSIYSKLFAQHVLSHNTSKMNIVSHELRMGPNRDEGNLNLTIEKILSAEEQIVFTDKSDSRISKKAEQYINSVNDFPTAPEDSSITSFFTLHFFKDKDTKAKKLNKNTHISRNQKLRQKVKQQSQTIVNLRNKFPKSAKYVRGIDAASSEINARPEVFAQAFRMLKHHQLRDNETLLKDWLVNNRLNLTFHAGEDFFDIVDGLRYIDECIYFLGMESGDRLGHALALGIDVQKYYELKKNKLLIPKHTLLDNLAWLLSNLNKYGIEQHSSEVYRLESLFKSLYSEIYIANVQSDDRSKSLLSHITYHEYYDSWMLRGDNPKPYLEYCTSDSKHSNCIDFFTNQFNYTYWDRCQLNNCNPKLNALRNREEIVRLYYEYHYNHDVKVKGEEIKQFEITIPYLKLVHDIQSKMMHMIAAKNIMIETNPTSNYLIGPIEKYVDHPITRWYNLGLETDPELINSCPQLCVSINTDDAGIFSTSLENEYALMAIALEKEKDENGNPKYKPSMIYDWLDRIRQMGIQQSFMNR
ncbi:amidohydrolase family protein [Sphingobacterium tabacisoli]|uniref:Adenosine deaminase domain-containing protein n=1 Tax=Sphingobacterium tabacisoli TaxID=2044855 RepID=A0ABW5L4D0_9SPHI|nr:hypothetical protein [Sphingobacterium tabacisoli]